jgi:hypothetical protein
MGNFRLHRGNGARRMSPKTELTTLIVKILLGLLVLEAVAHIVFQIKGESYNSPVWIVSIIAGSLTLILRAAYKEKK